LIEVVASGIPRLDYPLGGGCPALLVEPAATNFAPNVNLMNQFDTPTVSGGVALTTGSTDFLAPDGASGSINKYVGGTASNQSTRYAGAGVGVSASGTYRFSLFVKAGATNPLNFCAFSFGLFTGASGTATSYFNLASGTALTSGSSIENYGNGWYRCISAPYTIAAGDLSGTVSFSLAEGNNDITWPASGALNLTAYTWGAQIEAGSVATSYIPTTTGSVTRNADVINVSGAVSGCIGQTEGTIYAEVDIRNFVTFSRIVSLSNGTSSNTINLQLFLDGAVKSLRVGLTFLGSGQVDIIAAMPNPVNKIAVGYKENDFAVYLNGTSVGTDSTCNVPAMNKIDLGNFNGANIISDRIRSAALYTTRLTNAELIALSTL
jgi:hypothetical protein